MLARSLARIRRRRIHSVAFLLHRSGNGLSGSVRSTGADLAPRRKTQISRALRRSRRRIHIIGPVGRKIRLSQMKAQLQRGRGACTFPEQIRAIVVDVVFLTDVVERSGSSLSITAVSDAIEHHQNVSDDTKIGPRRKQVIHHGVLSLRPGVHQKQRPSLVGVVFARNVEKEIHVASLRWSCRNDAASAAARAAS